MDSNKRRGPLSIRDAFAWTLAGNVLSAACQWAIIVLLAKISNAEIVGQFSLAMAIAMPITFLADFRLRVLFVTDTAQKYDFCEMLGLRYVLSAASLVITLAVCAIARYDLSTSLIIIAIGLSRIIDSLSENYYGKFQRDERLDVVAISQVIRGILSASALIVIVLVTRSLVLGATGLALGRVLAFLFYDARKYATLADTTLSGHSAPAIFRMLHSIRPAWNPQNQLEMFWVALPLAIIMVLVSVNGYVPRYALEALLGRHALGIYSAISYVPSALGMLVIALGYAAFAKLSRLFGTSDLRGFSVLLFKITCFHGAVGLLGVLFCALAGRQLLSLVYRPEYGQYAYVLQWLMIVTAVQSLTTSMAAGLTAASQFRIQVPLMVGITGVSVIGCWILAPRIGLVGVAIATLISSVAQLIVSLLLILRTINRRRREISEISLAGLKEAGVYN